MKMRNENIKSQLDDSLSFLHQANSMLISAFPKEGSAIYGNDITQLLFTDVCSYLDKTVPLQTACSTATGGNVLGLLGLNDNYYDMINTRVYQYETNPTPANYLAAINYYISKIGGTVSVSVNAYTYLRAQLLNIFLSKIQEETSVLTKLFIGMCFGFLFATVLLKFFMLDKVRSVANLKNEVLRTLPYNLILANRPVVFYIRLEFTHDIEEIKSIL